MKKLILILLPLWCSAQTTSVVTKVVQPNLDTLITTTTTTISASSVTHVYKQPLPPPSKYVFSLPIIAKSGQIIKGDSINGGTQPCVTIPAGVSNVTVINCKLQHSKTNNGIIYVGKGCTNIVIRNNYINDGGRGVNLVYSGSGCQVVGNFISNTLDVNNNGGVGGSAVQFNTTSGANQRCDSNWVYTPNPNVGVGDLLSFYESSGTSTSYMSMKYNYVLGGSTYPAGKSAGVVGDVFGKYQDCEFNIAVNSGMEGWQVQGGTYIICSNNVAFSDGLNPVSNVGYAYGSYGGYASNNVTMANNRSNWLKKDKVTQSDFWFDNRNVSQPYGWATNKTDKTITKSILPDPLFKIN